MTPDSNVDLTPTPLGREHLRAARSLIGWLPPEMAHAVMEPGVPSADTVARAERARAAVAARAPVIQSTAVITDAPAELADHIKTLEEQPFYQAFLSEGWRVCLADLRHIRSAQTTIHTAHAQERTEAASGSDVVSLALITIPTARKKELLAVLPNIDGRTLTMTCRNPMLRLVGAFAEDRIAESGLTYKRLGFEVEMSTSLVQVVRWRGCYILRDGYHRTHGLLSRGIVNTPVIYREFAENEPPLQIPGLFDPSIYLADRPPMLTDFLDDTVSAVTESRKTQKTFVAQISEIDLPLL